MTAEEFASFLTLMGWNKLNAAKQLAISRNTVDRYLDGGTPLTIDLACAALAYRLPPWPNSADDRVTVSKAQLQQLGAQIKAMAGDELTS